MAMRSAFSAILVAACATPAFAADYWVRVMPGLWFEDLSGHIAYGTNGSNPSDIGLSELGLAGRHDAPIIEAGVQFPFLFSLHAGFTDVRAKATRQISRDITFANVTYTVSDTVRSEAELRDFYGELCVRPIDTPLGGLSVGIAIHALYAHAELRDLTTSNSETFEHTIPIPAASLRAHVNPLPGLTVEGRVHYITGSYGDYSGHFADVVGQIGWCPIHWIGVTAGYRLMDIQVELRDPEGNGSSADSRLRLRGPFVGIIAQF